MSAAITDLMDKVTDSTTGRPVITALSSPGKAEGASSVNIDDPTNWTEDTAIHFTIYKSVTVAGITVKDTTTQTDWKGVLSGNTISNLVLTGGVDRDYVAGDIVELTPTARWAKDLYELLSQFANQDGSLQGAAVREALGLTADPAAGYDTIGATIGTVTPLGNRSYSLVINSYDATSFLSEGMRLRATRTAAAPNKCATFDGTNDYFSKATPNKMTWTDDFTVSAWIKLTSYSGNKTIVSRYNGTSGWQFYIDANGFLILCGFNGGSGNTSLVNTTQAVPLNRWVHVTAQLDMSAYTATTTTSYIMFDGVDVAATVQRGGTNPTALVQAGNLEIGSANGGSFFVGKIAQVAIYNAKVAQSTILASMNQGLTGSETNLASGYSLNNSLTDLNTTTPNDLTANGGVLATTTDSPFGNSGISTLLDYGIIVAKPTFSTNTTVIVQVAEGCTFPTTGGITTLDYSSQRAPFGFPASKDKFRIVVPIIAGYTQANNGGTIFLKHSISVPAGVWRLGYNFNAIQTTAASTTHNARYGLETTSATNPSQQSPFTTAGTFVNAQEFYPRLFVEDDITLATQTVYYLNARAIGANFTQHGIMGMPGAIYADCSYL